MPDQPKFASYTLDSAEYQSFCANEAKTSLCCECYSAQMAMSLDGFLCKYTGSK